MSGRAARKTEQGSFYHPTLFDLPDSVNRSLIRRNQLSVFVRQSPAYRASDSCYNAIETLVIAIRTGRMNRPLSKRRQRELGIITPAEFLRYHRKPFQRLSRLYRVRTFRELFDHYGKRRGCWQFHHKAPPSEVDPDNEKELLARCHVSNVEPVTWLENMRERYRGTKEEPFQDLLGLWNQ